MAIQSHTTDKAPVEHGSPSDSKDLEVSYGMPVPQPKMKKGGMEAFGILAGSGATAPPVNGERGTNFGDSVDANERNL